MGFIRNLKVDYLAKSHNNNCKLNEKADICEGCGRTIKEIMNWKFMTNEEREVIIKRVRGWTF